MTFAPMRSRRSTHIVFALVLGFIIFSVIVLVFTARGFSLSMVILSILILSAIVMETSKLGWHYRVDEDGIRVKRTFKRYHVPAEDVESVKAIGWYQAEKILREARQGETRMKAQVNFGRVIGYCSIPMPVPDSRSFPATGGKRSQRSGDELFVSVKKKNGRTYLMTPKDTKGFVRACNKAGFGKRS